LSIRKAERILTGMAYDTREIEVILGTRTNGATGVTIKPACREHLPLDDPEIVDALVRDLTVAGKHLRGEIV
jgi:hypothetical protein